MSSARRSASLLAVVAALAAVPALAVEVRAAAACTHPNSISSSRVLVTGAAARLELHCQAQSLLEVFGTDADRDGDGWLEQPELDALREPLQGYVNERYVLRSGSGGDGTRGSPLAGTLTQLNAGVPDLDAAWPTQWVDLVLQYRAAELIPDLLIDVTLFREANPDHSDVCQLVWNGSEPVETQFWLGEYRRFYAPDAPPQPRPLLGWVRLGIGHILSGWDHLAFVVALIVAAGSARSLLGVVTAFTLAHSVTLALAALDLVHVSARPVEVVIALSIGWVGTVTLLARRPRARWREAFAFGLVHGLGFAGFLGEALYGEPHRLRALVGFNLGVEAGQLAVVAAVLVLLAAVRAVLPAVVAGAPRPTADRSRAAPTASAGDSPPRDAWLAPRRVRLPVCTVIVVFSLFWIVQRSGWLTSFTV